MYSYYMKYPVHKTDMKGMEDINADRIHSANEVAAEMKREFGITKHIQ